MLEQSPTVSSGTGDHQSRRFGAWAKKFTAQVLPRLGVRRSGGARPPVDGEAARLNALEALLLMDTAPEERFDRIAHLARRVFGTEFAAVTFVDDRRRWMKSAAGMTPGEVPRKRSCCQFTIAAADVTVIPDARKDPRTQDLFPMSDGVRFYAGYPLRAPTGHVVGALCVFDSAPRERGSVDTALLRDLALLAQREIWTVPAEELLTPA